MKKTIFEIVLKILAQIFVIYFLYLLTIFANNSGIGRYQFNNSDSRVRAVLDTKTGVLFYYEYGKQTDLGK